LLQKKSNYLTARLIT